MTSSVTVRTPLETFARVDLVTCWRLTDSPVLVCVCVCVHVDKCLSDLENDWFCFRCG